MDTDPLISTVPTTEHPATVDHHDRPISKSTSGGWQSSYYIIGVEIAERFAYYGIASNLITYLTGPLGQPTALAAANVNAWSGVASMLPLLGGFLADSCLGRYRTIVVASILYLLGLSMLTLSAVLPALHPPQCSGTTRTRACLSTNFQVAFFFSAIYIVALAQGCHKPCAQAFAADQFDDNDPEESKSKSSFFNWWYFAMCIGTTAALLVVNYVQDNVSWGLGFGIPCIAMVIALIVFLLGTKTYGNYTMPAIRSPFTIMCSSEQSATAVTEESKTVNSSYCFPSIKQDGGADIVVHEQAKGILRLFPIWATCLIYAVVFAQTGTLFTKQGSTMDGRIGRNLRVPPATLQTFISCTIVIFIPIYDRILVPLARKLTRCQSGITMLQRIGTGLFLSVISMVIAALVEMKRLKTAREFGLVDLPTATIPMSLWWLIPQYVVFGIADVFTIIGWQEFFYDQVPDGLRSLGVALYLSILGIGSFLSSFLIIVIDWSSGGNGESWFQDNLNRAHIDYFYWLLAVLSLLELVLYLYFARSYQYKKSITVVKK